MSVKIYTTTVCPYCVRAKKILASKGVAYQEIDVSSDDDKRVWLMERTGQRTVPQIFFGDDSIGGCSDLEALIAAGGLEARLKQNNIA